MRYEIKGDSLPVLIMYLEAEESIIVRGSGMSWMTPNMKLEASHQAGRLGKVFGRKSSQELSHLHIYTAKTGTGMISCASRFPGAILPFEIKEGKNLVLLSSAFLCAERNVELSPHYQKKINPGFFGGDGIVMKKISGSGICFAEFDGHVVKYELQAGQQIVIEAGNLAAMSETCTMDIHTVSGIRNSLFGGDELYNTIVTGPGSVWLQTMPETGLAASLRKYLPFHTGK